MCSSRSAERSVPGNSVRKQHPQHLPHHTLTASAILTASFLIPAFNRTASAQISGVPGTPPVMIYKGTATYKVEFYGSNSAKPLPAKYTFKDTVYLIKYNSTNDYIGVSGAGNNAIDAQGSTTAAGDAVPTSNQFALVFLVNAKHPFASGTAPGGDFDLSYDMAVPGINFPGDGNDLADQFNVSMGPLSVMTVNGLSILTSGSTFVAMPMLMDTSVNDVGSGIGDGISDGIIDNRRTQTLGLVGKLDAKPKAIKGSVPSAFYGGGVPALLMPPVGAVNLAPFAPGSLAGVYNALSIFNGGIFPQTGLPDPYNLANPAGLTDSFSFAMSVISGKWSLKLDTKLTANANNKTRTFSPVAIAAYTAPDAINAFPARTGAAAWAATFLAGLPTGDGTKYAGELAVLEALLVNSKPLAWNGAQPYMVTGFNGNFPSFLATILF